MIGDFGGMKLKSSILAITLAIASASVATTAKADTVQARCDVFPKGEDRAKSSGPCSFSQRQGFVGIQLKNGKRYDLSPVGNKPNTYRDGNGRPALRDPGLGNQGQIYRLATESIFVYWQSAPSAQVSTKPSSSSSSPMPITRMTRRNPNQIATQITEGEFKFSGVLTRTSGNKFSGSDGRVRVMYDRSAGQVVIINQATGTEFYNYSFTDVDEGRL
jgi:hypothetical protein